jgi:hypothetical protein
MYCKRCFVELPTIPPVEDQRGDVDGRTLDYATRYRWACLNCSKPFDPNRPATYLTRRFPSPARIIGMVVATTVFGIVCAGVVSMHQLVDLSGH